MPNGNGASLKEFSARQRKEVKTLFAYGSTIPLPRLGTFTASADSSHSKTMCEADFAVIEGDGRSLLCRNTAEELGLLHIEPSYINTVGGVKGGRDIKEK